MKELHFLIVGKNDEILQTLKRVIENNAGWTAEILTTEAFTYEYLDKQNPDILLLSSGLQRTFESSVKNYIEKAEKTTKVIIHYGGGSGLLKNEVYQLFPEMNV